MSIESLRYPVGRFSPPTSLQAGQIVQFRQTIADFPARMRAMVADMTDEQIDTPYRPEGWTVRQVIHHCADSHMNAIIRFKLALTEDTPTIKPYMEASWAELSDTTTLPLPVSVSLQLLEALHLRWVTLLNSLTIAQLERKLYHPEMEKELTLGTMLAQYDWHCRHHLGHVQLVLGTARV